MTDLQVAITAVAAIAVLWVLVSNQRERPRHRPSATRADPVVKDAERTEPVVAADADAGSASPVSDALAGEDGTDAADDALVATAAVSSERLFEPLLPSAIAESIAELSWPAPVAPAPVLQALRGWRHVGTKPLSFGWRVPGREDPVVDPGESHIAGLSVGILLATRSGPLHALEYTDWSEAMRRLAMDVGANLSIAPMQEVLTRARELDRSCADVDGQLAIALSSDAGISPLAMDEAAASLGLESRGESRYAKGSLHHQRFSLFPGDGGMGFTLLLDVPRTARPVEAFEEMLAAGRALAEALCVDLTDDTGRLLLAEDIAVIREQLSRQEARILALGITPGSMLAQRLFL